MPNWSFLTVQIPERRSLSFVPFKWNISSRLSSVILRQAQPLADQTFLTSQRSRLSHWARQHVFLSFTFSNLKQNYSVIARGYEDKARSRRRDRERERDYSRDSERERERLFLLRNLNPFLNQQCWFVMVLYVLPRWNNWKEECLIFRILSSLSFMSFSGHWRSLSVLLSHCLVVLTPPPPLLHSIILKVGIG